MKIIYEDSDVVVIDKPAGIAVHPDAKSTEETVSDWFAKTYPASREVGEPLKHSSAPDILRPGVVHRIDKETSGVLLLCKNNEAYAHAKEQFQERLVEKTYVAFVHGILKEKKGIIDLPIGRNAQDGRLRSAQRGAKGVLRDAITKYKVLAEGKDVSFVELYPKTGRMHQIRVHMKAINHQLVCDKLYAPKRDCVLGFDRLALHAMSLSLKLPSGEVKIFESALPLDFERAIQNLGNTAELQ